MSDLPIPNYLLQTNYGEQLIQSYNKSRNINKNETNDKLFKLTSSGIMGNVPLKYLNNPNYNEDLRSIIHDDTLTESLDSVRYADREEEEDDDDNDNDNDDDDDDEEVDDEDDDDEEEEDAISYNNETDDDMIDDSKRHSFKNSQSLLKSVLNGENSTVFKYPLPTKWEIPARSSKELDNKHEYYLHLTNDSILQVHEKHSTNSHVSIRKDSEILVTKANNYIPIKVGIFYYEIKVLSVTNNNLKGNCDVSIGFMNSNISTPKRIPGLEMGTYGFHGEDGVLNCNQSICKQFSINKFGLNDIIGCGVNFQTGEIFYTKNGINLGVAFNNVNKSLIPIIGLKYGNSISVNFGQFDSFLYDIDSYVLQNKYSIESKIAKLSNGKEINQNIASLINSYFDHLGYIDISKTFLKENEDSYMDDIDEENLKIRQDIRNHLINGNIDIVIKLTNNHFPTVLKDLEILFKLKSLKFLRFIKNGSLDKAIEFGQELKLEFQDDKFEEKLNDIFSLLAFESPIKSEFGYLLKDEEVFKIFDDLNSRILKSLGKLSISKIEELIKHNKSMLRYLNENLELNSLLITNKDLGI